MERVITYIDGFNLYFGLRSKKWQRYYWLNLSLLAKNLLKPYQTYVSAKYFTSRIVQPLGKHQRQLVYLEALETLPDFFNFLWKYQHNPHTCPSCGMLRQSQVRKMTDVNIAVEFISRCLSGQILSTALLISGIAIYRPQLKRLRQLFPQKESGQCLFRRIAAQKSSCVFSSAYFTIGRTVLADSNSMNR